MKYAVHHKEYGEPSLFDNLTDAEKRAKRLVKQSPHNDAYIYKIKSVISVNIAEPIITNRNF